MILLVGSDVDTPELDTNSLSISAAIYFAFYCLFLIAFFFLVQALHFTLEMISCFFWKSRDALWGIDEREL